MGEFQVTIVGLGVTGISLGLALKKAAADLQIVGHDREPSAATAARKAGAVSRTEWNLPAACRGADVVVLALPLGEIQSTLAAVGPDLAPGCLVTDTAPVKAPVLAWAREALPAQVAFVGGDPIGARGKSTAPAADLFDGTVYCLCPEPGTPPQAVERASDLAVAVGASPRFLDAAEHDGLVALLDQLPFALAVAVLEAGRGEGAWRDLAALGGGRFDRLLGALGDSPGAALEAAAANAENVSRWLDRAGEALEGLRRLLADGGPEARQEALRRLEEARAEWERRGEEPRRPMPSAGYSWRRTFGFPQGPKGRG